MSDASTSTRRTGVQPQLGQERSSNSVQGSSTSRQVYHYEQPQSRLGPPQAMSRTSARPSPQYCTPSSGHSSSGSSRASSSAASMPMNEPYRRGRGGIPRRRRADAGVSEFDRVPQQIYATPTPSPPNANRSGSQTRVFTPSYHVSPQRRREPSPAPMPTAYRSPQSHPVPRREPSSGNSSESRTRMSALDRIKSIGKGQTHRRSNTNTSVDANLTVTPTTATRQVRERPDYMYTDRGTGSSSERKVYNDGPYSQAYARQTSNSDGRRSVQVYSSNTSTNEPVVGLKASSSFKPLPPSPPPEEQTHEKQEPEVSVESQPASQNKVPVESYPLAASQDPTPSESPSEPLPEPESLSPPLTDIPVEASQEEAPSREPEASAVAEKVEKNEPLANLWARRMQNLVSGLSFSTSGSSTSSANSVTSETAEQPSTAPTTAPSLSSRAPSKSTQLPPPILSVPSSILSVPSSSKPVATPQIASSSSTSSLVMDIDEAIQSPQVQQQKQAVQSAAKLAALLASSREMNNSIAQGTSSSWSVLGWFKQPFTKGKNKAAAPTKPEVASDAASITTTTSSASENAKMSASERANAVFSNSGKKSEPEGARDIMLYAPLIPDSASTVEVASSEVVTLYDEENDQERAYRSELRRRWFEGRGYISRDAMRGLTGVSEGVEEDEEDGDGDGSDTETEGTVKNDSGRVDAPAVDQPIVGQANVEIRIEERIEEIVEEQAERPAVRERVIWKPSLTQISVQVLWWGYRIYLPPPVLEVLNNTTIEAAKRAALLTGALRWLLDNLPTAVLPIQFLPVVGLLQYLVPLLGAIGTFISWSWRAIGTFDKGYGVVLSATWLLPVVLVPGTWEVNEVPSMQPPSNTANGGSEFPEMI